MAFLGPRNHQAVIRPLLSIVRDGLRIAAADETEIGSTTQGHNRFTHQGSDPILIELLWKYNLSRNFRMDRFQGIQTPSSALQLLPSVQVVAPSQSVLVAARHPPQSAQSSSPDAHEVMAVQRPLTLQSSAA